MDLSNVNFQGLLDFLSNSNVINLLSSGIFGLTVIALIGIYIHAIKNNRPIEFKAGPFALNIPTGNQLISKLPPNASVCNRNSLINTIVEKSMLKYKEIDEINHFILDRQLTALNQEFILVRSDIMSDYEELMKNAGILNPRNDIDYIRFSVVLEEFTNLLRQQVFVDAFRNNNFDSHKRTTTHWNGFIEDKVTMCFTLASSFFTQRYLGYTIITSDDLAKMMEKKERDIFNSAKNVMDKAYEIQKQNLSKIDEIEQKFKDDLCSLCNVNLCPLGQKHPKYEQTDSIVPSSNV